MLLLLGLLLSLFSTLASCDGGDPVIRTKEELVANMDAEKEENGAYVSVYLDKWCVPVFDSTKLRGIEITYRDHYVNEVEAAFSLAKKTLNLFIQYFYDRIDLGDKTAVTDSLIRCYVASIGDKYSAYRTKEQYDAYASDLSGTFAGIGVNVSVDGESGKIKIESVMENYGAHEAGILAGDELVAADGVYAKDVEYSDFIAKIKGDAGTRVEITVVRDGEEMTFSVARKLIVEKSVSYSFGEEKIATVTITEFNANTPQQFKTAIKNAESDGAVGIIYDLRSNPGGYLSAVVDMLEYLIPWGTEIVSFSNGYSSTKKSGNTHTFLIPTVVLCNANTGSAAELFTAAIRDYSKMGLLNAKIVGETTYGKGVMQNTYDFTDGSAITMTVAYYNPPSGENYDGVGVVPDVYVKLAEGTDTQLQEGIRQLKQLIEQNKTQDIF